MTNNYYQKYKEKLQKQARERYQSLPEEKKKAKGEKRPERQIKFS